MFHAAAFILSFFIGAIPTAYIFTRAFRGIDIREHGSGNVGATNVSRVMGRKAGLFVFAVDFLKGFLPAIFFSRLFFPDSVNQELILSIGLTATLGHVFTPFLGFKGGKGIAAGAGAFCAAYPVFFFVSLAVWLVTFFATRIVSISSVLCVFALFVLSVIFKMTWTGRALFLGAFLFTLWTHRGNLARLRKGEEGGKKINS